VLNFVSINKYMRNLKQLACHQIVICGCLFPLSAISVLGFVLWTCGLHYESWSLRYFTIKKEKNVWF